MAATEHEPEHGGIDPRVARARTLPAKWYTDPESLVRVRERAFARTWLPLLEAEAELAPGAARPFSLLPGCLDEPLVLVRDAAGALRCLSNVCTHRANPIVREEGPVARLRCGYHGRCFDLDGIMLSAPGFDGVEEFPAASDDLPRTPLHACAGVTFTAIRPQAAFEQVFEPVHARLDGLGLERARFDPDSVTHYDIAAHWALYVDNYLEGFHVPFVHPGLQRSLAGYRTETFEHGSLQIGLAADADPALALPGGHPDEGQRIAAFYFWLFPGVMLNVYPWGLSLNVVTPLALDRTRVTFAAFVLDPSLRTAGAGGALDRVEREDEAIVEQVQRGIGSRLYTQGRFSPEHERCVHHFHRLLADLD